MSTIQKMKNKTLIKKVKKGESDTSFYILRKRGNPAV